MTKNKIINQNKMNNLIIKFKFKHTYNKNSNFKLKQRNKKKFYNNNNYFFHKLIKTINKSIKILKTRTIN